MGLETKLTLRKPMAHAFFPRSLATARPATLALCTGHAAAQTITFAPASAAATVPADHPLALLLAAVLALGTGLWVLRARMRPALLRGLVLAGVAGAAAAAFTGHPLMAWAQQAPSGIPPLRITIVDGQPVLVPAVGVDADGAPVSQYGYVPPTGFQPKPVINQSGVTLRVVGITPPSSLDACFSNNMVPRQLMPPPLPPGTPACTTGTVLLATCAVQVTQLCQDAAVNAHLATLNHPNAVTLQSPASQLITITNPGPVRVSGVTIPPNGTFSFNVVGQCDVIPAGGSCQLRLVPGAAAHAPEMLVIGAGNAFAVQFPVTTLAP
jgi:hypothetical protein